MPVIATVISGGIAWVVSRRAANRINEIHLIVNSQRAEMKKEIDIQAEQIRALKNVLRDLARSGLATNEGDVGPGEQ